MCPSFRASCDFPRMQFDNRDYVFFVDDDARSSEGSNSDDRVKFKGRLRFAYGLDLDWIWNPLDILLRYLWESVSDSSRTSQILPGICLRFSREYVSDSVGNLSQIPLGLFQIPLRICLRFRWESVSKCVGNLSQNPLGICLRIRWESVADSDWESVSDSD